MSSGISDEEISKFHELADSATTAEGLCEFIQWIVDRNEEGRKFWGNGDFDSFLNGLRLGVAAFTPAPAGDFAEIASKGPWRIMAEVILIGLEID